MCDLFNKNAIIYTNSFKYTPLNIPHSYNQFVNNERKKQTELYIKNDVFEEHINIQPLWPNQSMHENPSDYVKNLLPNSKYNLKNKKFCKFKGSNTSFYMFGNTDFPNMSISSDGYCRTNGYHLN